MLAVIIKVRRGQAYGKDCGIIVDLPQKSGTVRTRTSRTMNDYGLSGQG